MTKPIRRTDRGAAVAAKRRRGAPGPDVGSDSDAPRLVEELRIREAELKRQNEELRRVQVELAHARDRYSNLFEFAPVGYLTLDDAGRIEQANLTAAALLGAERDKIVGAPLSRFVARASRAALALHGRRIRSGTAREVVELALRRRRGVGQQTLEMQSVLCPHSTGEKPAWHAALVDVTRRKHAEAEWQALKASLERRVRERTVELRRSAEAARTSERELAALFDSAMDAIISVDSAQRITRFNAAAEEMFGWTAAQVIGKGVERLVPARWLKLMAADQRKLGRGKRRRLEIGNTQPVTARRADGTEFPIEGYLTRSVVGRQTVFTVTLRDITQRTRLLEGLLANEAMLLDIFAHAPIGLLWVDAGGRVERINDSNLKMLDCSSEEVVGRSIAEFFAEPEVAFLVLDRAKKSESVRSQRAQLRRKDGSIRHVLIDASACLREGQVVQSRWFIRDISHRLDLEREILAIAEREQHRIGHELHDDLCQQLIAIEYMTEITKGEMEAIDPEVAALCQEISVSLRRAIDRARDLARGLSPLMTMEEGGLILALEHLRERTQKVFRRTCSFEHPGRIAIKDPTVASHLFRIAQEAVGNAVKHGKASRIDIELVIRGQDLVLGVKDNGVGLPDPPVQGTGMGLRIMQYRAGMIAGSLVVQKNLKSGTAVVCTVRNALRIAAPATAP